MRQEKSDRPLNKIAAQPAAPSSLAMRKDRGPGQPVGARPAGSPELALALLDEEQDPERWDGLS